ncbi:response regulator transcription factor [Micromonospora echinospora]|uniref:response regulator transcription factor n=1 Tax=Micromonospora echinospora TaxID=1877 RepID=UPI0036708229
MIDAVTCCCHRDHLTPRELDVVELVALGMSNERIAERLCLSPHTVATHISTAMRRVGAVNRVALVSRCYMLRLLTADSWPPVTSGRRCVT